MLHFSVHKHINFNILQTSPLKSAFHFPDLNTYIVIHSVTQIRILVADLDSSPYHTAILNGSISKSFIFPKTSSIFLYLSPLFYFKAPSFVSHLYATVSFLSNLCSSLSSL
jgi:hypothetical protein